MTGFCKTYVPQEIADKLESIKDDEEAVKVGAGQLPCWGAQTCALAASAGFGPHTAQRSAAQG
jgi:hypothetical protein